MNTGSSRSKAKTLAPSFFSACWQDVPEVANLLLALTVYHRSSPNFMYATALNQIALFNVDTTDGTLTLPLGANPGTFPGPNDAEGLVADPRRDFFSFPISPGVWCAYLILITVTGG